MTTAMTSAKHKCDDCGQSDERQVVWVCVSHGTFVCEQCAGAHRSMGRHVTQIRRLSNHWPPALLAMVRELNGRCLVNSQILESALPTPSDKPNPGDSYELKAAFVRNKYQNLRFANLPLDITNATASLADLISNGRSLLDQALIFLLLGANPNSLLDSDIKSKTIVAQAAHKGLALMVELLCLWGGDPAIPDSDGQTADEICRNIDSVLSDRIIHIRHELTRRLETFAHKYVQDLAGLRSNITTNKICAMPENAFQDILKDIYDEIDRRECNALATLYVVSSDTSGDQVPPGKLEFSPLFVPFLPVNRFLSATRNQARQKLARLCENDFIRLVLDAVFEQQRRSTTTTVQSNPNEPLYDHVASEDEGATAETVCEANEAGKMCQGLSERVINLENQLKKLTSVNKSLRSELHSLKHHLIDFIEQKQTEFNSESHVCELEDANGGDTSPEAMAIRFSQTMESDYDNNVTSATKVKSSSLSHRLSCETSNDAVLNYANELSSEQPSELEQVTMNCIECISRFHRLIKSTLGTSTNSVSNQNRIATNAEEVRQVLHWLANDAAKSPRPPTSCMINQLKFGADRLFCLASDHKMAANAGNSDQAQRVLNQMIDCCYEIGCCMKRLVGMTVAVNDFDETTFTSRK